MAMYILLQQCQTMQETGVDQIIKQVVNKPTV